jgi:hypothetical protein
MHMQVLAGLVARGGILVADGVIGVQPRVVVMGRMAVHPVVAMRMHVEGRQNRRIAVQAAGAQGDGNHKNAQNPAGQVAHTKEKPEDSGAVKLQPGRDCHPDMWPFDDGQSSMAAMAGLKCSTNRVPS